MHGARHGSSPGECEGWSWHLRVKDSEIYRLKLTQAGREEEFLALLRLAHFALFAVDRSRIPSLSRLVSRLFSISLALVIFPCFCGDVYLADSYFNFVILTILPLYHLF